MSQAPKIADRTKELSYTTGTNAFLLEGSINGFSSFASSFDNGDVIFYAATDGTDYEVGSGVFTDSSADTISRFVLASSNSNNLVSFSAGAKEVYSTYPATNAIVSLSGVVPKSSGVTFWLSDKTIGHDSNFVWNNVDNRLGINQSNPSFSIDVGGTSAFSIINTSGVHTGVSGILFASGTTVPSYSGGRQLEHFERNILGDANIQSVIELSGVVDQYLFLKPQDTGLIFAGPASGCGVGCPPARPSFRTLVLSDVPDLIFISGQLMTSGVTNAANIVAISGMMVDTPSGVHSYLARWSDDDTLGASSVYESGGVVGIGTSTTATGYKLDVRNGDILVGTKLVVGSGVYSQTSPGTYFGLKHTSFTSPSEYMIMSNGTHTYLSAKEDSDVIIRGGANNVDHQVVVSKSGITLGKYRPAASSVVPEHDVDIVYDESNGSGCIRIADRNGSGIMIGDCALESSSVYAGMKHTEMAGTLDYMIASSGTHTFISARDGSNVFIRGGGHSSECQISVLDVGAGSVGIVFNDNGADRDLRMEGASNDNLFRLDASEDRIGIGTDIPQSTLDVSGVITADSGVYNVLDMNLTEEASYPTHQEGRVWYDSDSHALVVYNDESEVTQQVGQEEYLRVRNNTGSIILNGSGVRITGSHGNVAPTVEYAIASGEDLSRVVGLATHDIEHNSFGYVTTYGLVKNVNTAAFTAGDELFLSETDYGSFKNTSPRIPNYSSPIGYVVREATNGSILVELGKHKLGGGDVKSLDMGVNVSGIPFIEASGNGNAIGLANVDNFVYDSGSARLGIGTSNPTSTVSVSGQLEALEILQSGSSIALDADLIHTSGMIDSVSGNMPLQGTIATASTAGTLGQIRWDSNYIYVCVATNTWKRVLLSTW